MIRDKALRKAEFKRWLKGQLKALAGPLIICLIILIGVLVIINYRNEEPEKEIIRINGYAGDDTEIVMENDKLKFVMDPLTTHFTVEVKETGKIWYSNPEGGASDPIAQTSERGRLQSTLALTWSTVNGVDALYNNYDYSIEKGVYDIETGEDYVKVYYSIGDTQKQFVIPPVLTEENFNKWLDLMGTEERNMLKEYYKKYDINNLGKRDNKEELLSFYPVMENTVIYVLRDKTKDALKKRFEGYFEAVGYTLEDYEADKALDNSVKSSDKPVFNVNMIYRLDGDDLLVEVPLREMDYQESRPIYNLTILPFFGAGSTEDEGFLLVPEGGGALINFNNGKVAQNSYYANVYGWDMALSRIAVVHNTRTYFNTYGISNGNDSFLCILEDGASYASVQADISGRYSSYNSVSSVYSIASREKYDVGDRASSSIYVYLPELPDESLVQRYSFINSGNYVDMAKDYQSYMADKYGDYMTMNDDTEAPVAVEIIGAVDKMKQVLGVPVSKPLKLTTYKEAGEIITELKNDGLNNMDVKLSGWMNGGIQQKILDKVKTISDLGSKKDLQNTINAAKELGVNVYLDGVTQYAYDSDMLDGFFVYTDAARFISKEKAELYKYSAVTYAQRESQDVHYLLKADLAEQMAQNLTDAAGKYGAGVSFREIGDELAADYYRKNMVSREESLNRQSERLKNMADAGTPVMINVGNDYAAVYSDMITNMELQGSEYTIIDTYVPFYQIALHGYVNYTGEALNLTGNTEDELLRSAEYGAGLYFTVMNETAFALQKTLYTDYFGADYAAWHDRIVDTYSRYNAELGHTFNQQMTDHVKLSGDLSCTTYADGTKVYVNYGYLDAQADGVSVPARDYVVVR